MQSNTEKIVVIRVASPSRILPDDVQLDTTNTIGSKFDKTKSGVPLMGLNEKERIAILPSLINVSPSDVNWNKAVNNFYYNLSIKPDPIEGLKLNISTSKRTVNIAGKDEVVDYPESPRDYVMYRQCLVDNSVARNFKEAKEGTFSFYIDDEQAEKQREIDLAKNVQKLESKFLELCKLNENDEYVNVKEIKLVARLLGRNPAAHTVDELVSYIKDSKNSSIRELNDGSSLSETEFITIVNDPKLKLKSVILSLVEYGFVIKQGEYYIDAKERSIVLGQGLDNAVRFLEDQNNSDTILRYKHELQSKTQTVEV